MLGVSEGPNQHSMQESLVGLLIMDGKACWTACSLLRAYLGKIDREIIATAMGFGWR